MEKKCIILSLKKRNTEIKKLAETLNYHPIEVFIQNREKPDVNFYFGKGKIEEINDFIKKYEENIDLIIINDSLKPSQWFNLEKYFKIEVFDRVNLILKIFEKRAERKEAKLQVKLAQLQYQRPFVRELIHKSKAGEHPGLMAGGEYQVDYYYENLKKQMKKIKNDLEKIRNQRKLRRRHRHSSGFYLVSLAGYTNAGKSSLLNLLSKDEVKVEDKLFSTLSTTTRYFECKNIPLLLTDTVGFIENLPAMILNAFHSTLEEIKLADLVVLVIDISEDEDTILKKINVSLKELTDLGVESPKILVYNKIDLISEIEKTKKINFLKEKVKNEDFVEISIKNKKNIKTLYKKIYDNLPKLEEHEIILPMNDKSQSLLSEIYNKANVFDIEYNKNIILTFKCNNKISDKILNECKKINGLIIK